MKNYLYLILIFFLSSCFINPHKTNRIDSKDEIGLENEFLRLGFNKKNGELSSLTNKEADDIYLKKSGNGNIFRLYVDTDSMPSLVAGAHESDYGGTIIEPSSSNLKSYAFLENQGYISMKLTYCARTIPADIIMEIELPDSAKYFDVNFSVVNTGENSFSIYTAFPYLSGICLGKNPETNLAVNMWDRGYPGIKAWEKPSGGVYGSKVSMQWQCVYEPALKVGLAFIAMDTLFTNKILTCFPGGGMTSLYFDNKIIEKGEKQNWPSSRIIVFEGNWRKAAEEYRNWFSSNIKARPVPLWYKSEVAKRSSAHFPPKESVDRNKKNGNKDLFTSFVQLHDMYRGNYDDCLEFAMWNEDVNIWPETYGSWMSSGFIDFRSDLGGVAALKKGVENCHRYGRKVAMYVAGYGARKESPIFKGKWQNSAIMINSQGVYDSTYSSDKEVYGAFNCPGYKPWQDNIIKVCTMLAKTGIDEIRLDEIGFPFRPCFNPVHKHQSPYDCNKWMMEYLQRVREAVDSINPELVITTEFFMDYFHKFTNGALVMDCAGNEIDAMKIALPAYLPLSYHASASEAAITGAIMVKTESKRRNWAWANIGTEKPDDYNEEFVRYLKWHELYPTFAEAVTYGDITEWDPVALNDPKWMGHTWKSKDFWVLTGGHVDATPLEEEFANVTIPGLPESFSIAYEFNVETLEMRETEVESVNNNMIVKLKSPVSAVLYPFKSCPALPLVEQQQITTSGNKRIEVVVSLFAPWKDGKLSGDLSTLKLVAPGFEVSSSDNNDKKIFAIFIPDNTAANDFYYRITGNCLDVKRWFTINK